jgi:hypothetical protein
LESVLESAGRGGVKPREIKNQTPKEIRLSMSSRAAKKQIKNSPGGAID